MAKSRGIVSNLLLVCFLGSLMHASHAALHTVSWIVPPTTPYNEWAAKKTFRVNDVLVFNFVPGVHDLVMVTPTDASACDASNGLQTWTKSPVQVTLDQPGSISFICSFTSHCALGMKLDLQVVPLAEVPENPTPSNPPPTPSLPSPPTENPVLPPAAAPPPPKKKSVHKSAPVPGPELEPQPAVTPGIAPAPGPGGLDSGNAVVLPCTTLLVVACLLVQFML